MISQSIDVLILILFPENDLGKTNGDGREMSSPLGITEFYLLSCYDCNRFTIIVMWQPHELNLAP